jgi:choline dehydrogenase-like flavoprotein
MTAATAQYTDFSKDVLGRYVCNGLDEARASVQAGGRPFDIIVVGGGSFGAVLAQHLLYSDRFHNHRILVLEAGPFVLPEHVQNLPTLGLVPPGPTASDPGVPRNEVWGLPWRAPQVADGYPGLAYCVGGRSVFWGGWSPRLLDTANDTEMPRDRWPQRVVDALNQRYFDESASQIGTTETNDFIFGAMHRALRKHLYDGVVAGRVTDAIQPGDLPLHLSVDGGLTAREKKELRLEAPLAVQGRAERSGFFPQNKFSGVPVLIRAARQAWFESGGNDAQKRLMVVPDCHVTRLRTRTDDGVARVTAVETNLGTVDVPDRGVVVIAAGTIESSRLALLSFGETLHSDLIGSNLIAHMRSNYTVRIPRTAVDFVPGKDLEASALFVKCRHVLNGKPSYFHIQITAAGAKGIGANSEAELFQKIPDIDTVDGFRAADEDSVVITFRGVGEMQPGNPDNRVTLSDEHDEFGVPRALVRLGNPRSPQPQPGESPQTAKDRELWNAMDQAAQEIRAVFAADGQFQELGKVRDGLGTTHHESGTLWMGVDPARSVTTPNARFHQAVNAYAIGPALLPTMGSPNPMLSGVALARRLAEHLVAPLAPPALESGFAWLFDGRRTSFDRWRFVGGGGFDYVDAEQVLTARPGDEIGLLYYPDEQFGDFVLRLQFRIDARGDNSGVFLRFHDPARPPAGTTDPNPARVAVVTGFEAQIDDLAAPDRADMHRTGAIYDIDPGVQQYRRGSALQPGEWNDYELEVRGDTFSIRLNEHQTAHFVNPDAGRGRSPAQDPASGYVGLQAHTGAVSFRAVRIKA